TASVDVDALVHIAPPANVTFVTAGLLVSTLICAVAAAVVAFPATSRNHAKTWCRPSPVPSDHEATEGAKVTQQPSEAVGALFWFLMHILSSRPSSFADSPRVTVSDDDTVAPELICTVPPVGAAVSRVMVSVPVAWLPTLSVTRTVTVFVAPPVDGSVAL